jgi:hypothetical protein
VGSKHSRVAAEVGDKQRLRAVKDRRAASRDEARAIGRLRCG